MGQCSAPPPPHTPDPPVRSNASHQRPSDATLLKPVQLEPNSRALGVLKSSWYLLLCEDRGTLLNGTTLLEEKGMKPREPLVCWRIFVDLDSSQSCPLSGQCLVSGQCL